MLPLDTPQLTGTSELGLIQSRDALSVSDTSVLNIMPCGDAPQIIDEETHLEQLNAKNVTTENSSFEAAADPFITDRSIVFDDHMCSIPVEEIIPSPSKLSNVDSMSNRDAHIHATICKELQQHTLAPRFRHGALPNDSNVHT